MYTEECIYPAPPPSYHSWKHRRRPCPNSLTIRSLTARAVIAPLARPLRTASGEIPAAPLLLIDIATDQGITGRAYLFGYTKVTLRALKALTEDLAPLLVGKPCAPQDRAAECERAFRLLGRQGLLGMALSGIDMALWDALGRALGQPVAALLGGAPRAVDAYDSFGLIDIKDDAKRLERVAGAGLPRHQGQARRRRPGSGPEDRARGARHRRRADPR